MNSRNERVLEIVVKYRGRDARQVIEAIFDDLAETFANSTGIEDGDISVDFKSQELTFTMTMPTSTTADAALATGASAVRSALHGCNQRTPNWPTFADMESTLRTVSRGSLQNA